jgi:ABC-type anion transport system duplicated permease subunit
VFRRTRRRSLYWARCIRSTPSHPISILILSSHIRLGLPNGPFPSGFPTKILHAVLIFPTHATFPTHLIFPFITLIKSGDAHNLWSSLFCSLLKSLATSFLLDPNMLLSTLFSNTFVLYSYLSVIDQVSHPYKETGKIICMYTLCGVERTRKVRNSYKLLFGDLGREKPHGWQV